MTPLLVGLAVGTTLGAVAVYVLVVDPLRRERLVWRDRILKEQARRFATEGRMYAERVTRDDHNGSRKALRSV